ncbi:APC family permease [Micrococcales bacterium 31B]|nr:APC family permease [Micrococcales bacterium 31B]
MSIPSEPGQPVPSAVSTPASAPSAPSAPSGPSAPSTALRKGAVGVLGILFFVLSAQAPLTGIAGALPLTVFLGNGAGAPGAYLVIGVIIGLFAVGFIAMGRRVSVEGAFFAYITVGLGRRLGTGSAWIALLSYTTVQAAMYGLYGATFSALLAQVGVNVPWWLLCFVTIIVVQVLGSLNIEFGARLLAVLVGCETLILLAFALVTVFRGGGPSGGFDVAASFSPGAIMAGAPGIALMFAVASMIGFESTAIYSSEAKDPVKTVARATYLCVIVISLFFAFVSWAFVAYYGAGNVGAAAQAAVESGDSTQLVFHALDGMLGAWTGTVGQVLLVTSLLAGILAFHNGINRYVHALAGQGSLPRSLAQTNRHLAPHRAARLQTVVAVLVLAPFAALGLDPVLTLFSWFSGLAVAALVTLYILCSIAVVAFGARGAVGVAGAVDCADAPGGPAGTPALVGRATAWETRWAPLLATALLGLVLWQLVQNFTTLIGGSLVTAVCLLLSVPIAFGVGFVTRR